jgi:tetratricopeptide (TPR) repeat protein
MKTSLMVMTLAVAGSAAFAQSPAQTQFEAGQFGQVVATLGPQLANPATDPWNHFLAIQAYIRLEQPSAAAPSVAALTASEHPEWRLVGESIQALSEGNVGGAIDRAERATQVNANHFAAHYQLGLAKARAEDWAGAAGAFERALELNPTFAYAAYYAALSYSKVNRADKTAEYFERFMRMAPSAPERPGVQSILRTLRGK